MKRIAIAAIAAATLVTPLTATAAYADPPRQHDGRGDDSYRNDRYDDRDNDRRDNDRDNDRYQDRRDDNGRHHGRDNRRWDNQRHNGYTYNGRWNYGPPPAAYENQRGYEAGYRTWRRGDRLPSYYQSRYRQVDYRREHLRAPPRGYQYVEDDRGDTLLLGIATGVILSVILNNR